jgi:alpha-glucosidase (family GH31 glycosyl hydrolase)
MRPDRTGVFADMYSVKAGRHSGDYGGFPVPFFLSTRGYGVFVNNPWPHVYFDMGRTHPDEWFVHAPGGDCDIFVIRGPEFADILRRFTDLAGRLPPPRRWWMGLWSGSLSLTRVSEILDMARRFRAEKLPCDVAQIDGNWRGGPEFLQRYMVDGAYTSNDFEWHPDFGDGKAMVRELKQMGVRTALHINSRSYKADTTERGIREGWLRRHGNEVIARVGDPSAETEYRKMLAGRIADGIGCWLQDHGDRVGGELLPGIPSRNLFGAMWARATTDACPSAGDPDRIVFTRGCAIGGQRHAIVWSGDTRFGIDFFREDLWFLINAGLAGYPLASADLGGFYRADNHSSPCNEAYDRDNLARRVVQSLFFMPTPRIHDDGTNPPKFPWNCPPDIARVYADMLKLRYRMIPYHYSYLVHAHRTGEPVVRHLVHHHRRDRMAADVHDQLYLGDWLMVAPVVEKGARSRSVYLPEGTWYDFWNRDRFRGPCAIRVEAPLCELRGLPVFVRGGAVIPTQDDVLSLTDEPPARLTLDLFPAGESVFALHEGPDLTHEFRCVEADGCARIALPNHTAVERVYRIRCAGREQSVTVLPGRTAEVAVGA